MRFRPKGGRPDRRPRPRGVWVRRGRVGGGGVEELGSKIVRELESMGESEITSETIGEAVMDNLRTLDDVAYVRFASVYKNFREPKDFEQALAELSGEDEGKSPEPRPVVPARK